MTSPRRLSLQVVVVLLLALPAFAYRREYVTTVDGQRKAGSEVCFYRGVKGDAFSLFFTPGNVACLPADAILDFPPGLIHVFARHKDGYASVHRDYTIYEGPPNPERGYEKLEIPMVRAGTVDFSAMLKSLQPAQRLGLWIASSPTSSGTFVPLVPGESAVLAPAEMMVIPLLIDNCLPAAVGEPLYLAAGERATALLQPAQTGSDVMVSTRVDRASLDGIPSDLPPPAITIRTGNQTYKPVAPLFVDFNSIIIFRGIPHGKVTLNVDGRMWKPVRREINVPVSQRLTVEREPIALVAGGSILLRWSGGGPPPTAADCAAANSADLPYVRATVLHCTTAADGRTCAPVADARAPHGAATSVSFDGVPPGSYSVLIEPPYGRRQSLAAEVEGGRLTTIDVNLPVFSFFGTVRLNDKPIGARLIFASGQALAGRDGRYTAALAGDPLANEIEIERCDDGRRITFIPHQSPQPNSVYDIDMHTATLEVKVVDADAAAVAGASVHFSPIKQVLPEGTEVWFTSADEQTTPEGVATFEDVPAGFLTVVCATHRQFGRKCSTPIDLKELSGHPAVVRFDRAGMRGRVEGHTGAGSIAVVTPAGFVTEEAPIAEDGSFLLHARHSSPEYLIYVSRTRALTVVPLAPEPPSELVVAVPAVPIRTFTVRAPGMKGDFGFIGVWVGGRYVPLQVLNRSQELRGLDSILYRNKSVEIRDVAETGPITIALGQPDPAAGEFADVFTLPQYAGVARVSVSGPYVVIGR